MKVLKTFLIAVILSVVVGFIAVNLTDDPVKQTAIEAGASGVGAISGDIMAFFTALFAGGGVLAVLAIIAIGGIIVVAIFSFLGSLFGGFGGFDGDY